MDYKLTPDDIIAINMGKLELGKQHSSFEYNDFRRCKNERCKMGYFTSATSRIPYIKCPECGFIQDR